MKHLFFTIALLFASIQLFSQETVDSLIQIGIQYHDEGQYEKAIETYKQALEIDSESMVAHAELALTYMHSGDYKKSIRHSDVVIKNGDDIALSAYITKGSSLDYLGKTKRSIRLFKKGIKEFGHHYLLHYNLAYNYYQMEELEDAEESVLSAIKAKTSHSSSHLLLGYIRSDKSQKVQSLLSLYFFLLLEPDSKRSQTAYNLLQQQFQGDVEKNEDNPNEVNIYINADNLDSEFNAAELMLSMLHVSKDLEENQGKTEEELFIDNTTSFFNVLGELKKETNEGLCWDFYVPFFYDIAISDHIDTFCYYISKSSNEKAMEWINNNEEKLKSFGHWMEKQ
ncbi:MAG: tetratricopeptide repeat protein [Bacteroidales bacterium]|nr:tetratricopeptide repeat protein [Bacteroidales bacterium]